MDRPMHPCTVALHMDSLSARSNRKTTLLAITVLKANTGKKGAFG